MKTILTSEVHRVAEKDEPLALVVGELDLLELAVLDEGALEVAGGVSGRERRGDRWRRKAGAGKGQE